MSEIMRNYRDYDREQTQDLKHLDLRARMALDIAKQCAMVVAESDGEDSAGRQRIRLLDAHEVALRAVRIAADMWDEFEKRNWLHDLPEMPDR